MTGTLNNFSLIKISSEKPPGLVKIAVISSHQVYNSLFNLVNYTVYDEQSDQYYTFEDSGAKDVVQELRTCIKTVIRK
jgi:hypothetical protein